MKHLKRRSAVFIISSACLVGGFFCSAVFAATQDVLVTELMYDAQGADTHHEWVELFNAGAEPVTIIGGSGADGWRLFDGTNHIFVTTTLLQAHTYAVVVQDSAQFLQDYPAFTGMLVESSFSLDNAVGQAGLRVGTTGTLWSFINYSNTWGGSGNGYTLAKRDPLGGANTAEEWGQSATFGGTPGAPNTVAAVASQSGTSTPSTVSGGATTQKNAPSPSGVTPSSASSGQLAFSAQLFINELYPAPHKNEKEWIEFYNPNASAVDLTGWKLADNSSTTTLYGSINAHRFIYWEFSKTHLTMRAMWPRCIGRMARFQTNLCMAIGLTLFCLRRKTDNRLRGFPMARQPALWRMIFS